jgi:hypothetical protein
VVKEEKKGLAKKCLQTHGQVADDERRFIVEVVNGLFVERGRFQVEYDQQGVKKHRIVFEIKFGRLDVLILIGFDEFRFVVATAFLVVVVLLISVHRATHLLRLVTAFGLGEEGHTLQFILAIVLIDHQAGGADEEQECEGYMCDALNQ